MNKLGFMQGRLTDKGGFYPQQFPTEQWEREFAIAAQIGFDCMEWMFNFEQWTLNPIVNSEGIKKICKLINRTGIEVSGICANYFMHKSIYDFDTMEENISILLRLVENAGLIGCSNIIIPLFEASEIQPKNKTIKKILEKVSNKNVNILLETDCEMGTLYKWLEEMSCKNIGLCYDIGNATGLGRDTVQELNCYANFVKNVHIKDKKKQGNTVMLGQGDAKIGETIEVLRGNSYEGWLILESYYGLNAIEDTKKNFIFVKDFLK